MFIGAVGVSGGSANFETVYRLIEFIRRSYVAILFVVLEIAAVNRYIQSTPYTRARMLSKVTAFTGDISNGISRTAAYFGLSRQNEMLTARIAELEDELAALRVSDGRTWGAADSVACEDSPYVFIPARVVSNSVNRTHNFITLNRGLRDGVVPESAVVTASGAIAGYVLECSERYSVAVSILNTSFRTSGKIEGTNFSGSLEWRGGNRYEVTLCELSKYADLSVGAKVVTTGFSHYFLPDMTIGTVESFEMDDTHTSFTASVRLAVDMSSLQNVLIIKNTDRGEVTALEESAKKSI